MHGVKKILKQFEKLNLPEYLQYFDYLFMGQVQSIDACRHFKKVRTMGWFLDVLNNLTIIQLQHLEVEY